MFLSCSCNNKRRKAIFHRELPLTDDRKGTEKKKHPFMDDTDLEELGDGYASASEMKYCGARYIFNQKIDITQIEQIEIIKYKISR